MFECDVLFNERDEHTVRDVLDFRVDTNELLFWTNETVWRCEHEHDVLF
jgi:hypothetical protein